MSCIKWRRCWGSTMSRIKWRRCRGRCHKHSEATIKDQSSHYDHEKDKFAYLSMRDRIEIREKASSTKPMGYTPQAMPTSFEYINHPNLTSQPQPKPSMSTSSLEQAILKISKVMEDFVGEQQKINSHLNEKIDNLESSMNVRMEGVYNDLSLRIEKVQDSIEKLTNLDIARGKRKLPPQPHHNLQGTNAKRSRKVQDDKGLLEPFKASTSPGKRRETNSLGPNGKDANLFGIQGEFSMKYDACKNRSYSENKGKQGRKPKQSNSHHRQLLGTFQSPPEVHFMHTISRFKAWEVRSP
ncbi:hypothetical protein CK203_112572 [Vitis vinifera]|uniref:Uncharacterized protein n=1 Tax=Vitis vinifera TaxID=29760 RepID=A0A438CF30_VITVI|nr:hypothetical protein CK203_112572 [Vitis vinifera]